jgi:hypothetical protein
LLNKSKKSIFSLLKQLHGILLISLLLWSQYARQLSYVQCLITNSINAAAITCDCEKIKPDATSGSNSPAHSKNHLHYSIDDWYNAINPASLQACTQQLSVTCGNYQNAHFCRGFLRQNDRPPQRQ